MKERPILFSPTMARAILAGQKTQTRRVVKPTQSTPKVAPLHMEPYLWQGEQETDDDGLPMWIGYHPDYPTEDGKWFSCPHGGVGDHLWVREAWALVPQTAYRGSDGVQQTNHPTDEHDAAVYAAGWDRSQPGRWRPSIHMPRWASRLTLEITEVRVERLQDISEEDALAEGIRTWAAAYCSPDVWDIWTPQEAYARLWDSINGTKAAWESNPYVWVLSLARAPQGEAEQ